MVQEKRWASLHSFRCHHGTKKERKHLLLEHSVSDQMTPLLQKSDQATLLSLHFYQMTPLLKWHHHSGEQHYGLGDSATDQLSD